MYIKYMKANWIWTKNTKCVFHFLLPVDVFHNLLNHLIWPSCAQHLCHPVNPGWSVGGRSLPDRWAVSVPHCPAACWLNHLQISGRPGLHAATAPAGRPSADTHGGQLDGSTALLHGPGTQTQHNPPQGLSVDYLNRLNVDRAEGFCLPASFCSAPPTCGCRNHFLVLVRQ